MPETKNDAPPPMKLPVEQAKEPSYTIANKSSVSAIESLKMISDSLNKIKPDTVADKTITPPTAEVTLTNNERNPSNWKIFATDNGKIEAYCGGHVIKGTTEEFNTILRNGKYTK
jgi:hypothetical protein